MKLYELSNGMWFWWQGKKWQYSRPDGMYGICRNMLGETLYLMMGAEVELDKEEIK